MDRLMRALPFFLILSSCGEIGKDVSSPGEETSTFKVSDPLRGKVSEAQAQFQNAMYEFLNNEEPSLQEVFEINRDLQIAMTHRGDMRYEHLWNNSPSRISTDDGYIGWLNFDWTESDETQLMAASSEYARLQERLSLIEQKNQGHPMWPEAREVFGKIQTDARMTNIYRSLQKVFDEINRTLESR